MCPLGTLADQGALASVADFGADRGGVCADGSRDAGRDPLSASESSRTGGACGSPNETLKFVDARATDTGPHLTKHTALPIVQACIGEGHEAVQGAVAEGFEYARCSLDAVRSRERMTRTSTARTRVWDEAESGVCAPQNTGDELSLRWAAKLGANKDLDGSPLD